MSGISVLQNPLAAQLRECRTAVFCGPAFTMFYENPQSRRAGNTRRKLRETRGMTA